MGNERGKSGSYSHCVLHNLPPKDFLKIKLTKNSVNFQVGFTVLWVLKGKENDADMHQTIYQFLNIAKGRRIKKAALVAVIDGAKRFFPEKDYPLTSEWISNFLSKKRKRNFDSPLAKDGCSRF